MLPFGHDMAFAVMTFSNYIRLRENQVRQIHGTSVDYLQALPHVEELLVVDSYWGKNNYSLLMRYSLIGLPCSS